MQKDSLLEGILKGDKGSFDREKRGQFVCALYFPLSPTFSRVEHITITVRTPSSLHMCFGFLPSLLNVLWISFQVAQAVPLAVRALVRVNPNHEGHHHNGQGDEHCEVSRVPNFQAPAHTQMIY